MIFILSAIIILIVSFVVALISLVREQAKFEREIDFQKAKEGDKVPAAAGGRAHDQDAIEVTGDLTNKLYEPTQVEEPFPWEMPIATQTSGANLNTQNSTGNITSDAGGAEDKTEHVFEETNPGNSGRLSGVISLRGNRDADSDKD